MNGGSTAALGWFHEWGDPLYAGLHGTTAVLQGGEIAASVQSDAQESPSPISDLPGYPPEQTAQARGSCDDWASEQCKDAMFKALCVVSMKARCSVAGPSSPAKSIEDFFGGKLTQGGVMLLAVLLVALGAYAFIK